VTKLLPGETVDVCVYKTLILRFKLQFLYTNIDWKLPNKSHGPIHYKIGVSCVYNRHMVYTLL